MSTPYDPLTSDFPVDATIGAVTYIVTDFADNGAAAVETNFSNSNGSWRGRRLVSGERTANMTIEVTNAAQVTPAQGATFSYRSSTWVIKTVGRQVQSVGPATMPLTLGWVSTP